MATVDVAQEQFIERLPLAVCACDRQGCILNYNQRAIELWGRTPGDRDLFTAASRLYDSAGRALDVATSPMGLVLSTGHPQRNCEVILERANGMRVPVLSNVAPLTDEYGRLVGAVDVFQDISDRKRSEEARRVAERLAASSRIASEIAREMNPSLHSMTTLLDLLRQDSSLSAEARYYAESAQQQLSRLARIARETLGAAGMVA
jgi:signal transduction histidine kinase